MSARHLLAIALASGFLNIPLLHAQTIVPPGNVGGLWTASGSPYLVQGEITVPSGDSLTIAPGCSVIFQGHYKLIVNGWLLAIGTQQDSIVFTAADTNAGWWGVRFVDAADSGKISYSVFKYGRATGTGHDDEGGGIYFENSEIDISHCTFWRCRAIHAGAGIGGFNAFVSIANCNFISCDAYGSAPAGGGIWVALSVVNITNCLIEYCHAGYGGGMTIENGTDGIISKNVIIHNTASGAYLSNGGGILCIFQAHPTMTNNLIGWNNSSVNAGGVIFDDYASPIFKNNIVIGNSCPNIGGGVLCSQGSPIIENCVLSSNSANGGGGIWLQENTVPTVRNTIVANTLAGGAIQTIGSQNTVISNCDFYNNVGGNFIGNLTPGIGVISTTNHNGDSCDVYQNIFLNPRFIAPNDTNYHLMENSPCVDGGDTDIIYNDPEDPWNLGMALWPSMGTVINDIGAYGGPETAGWGEVQHDVGVNAILSPPITVPFDTTLSPRAIVQNSGIFAETFPVNFHISLPAPYNDQTTVTLQPGQMDTVTFDSVHFQYYGTFGLSCWTALIGDQNPSNDTLNGTVNVHGNGGPEIYSITPNYGGNAGFVTVEITGANFADSAMVKLTREGYSDIFMDTSRIYLIDSTHIAVTFNLTDQTIGTWNLVVTNPDGQYGIFFNGFVVQVGNEQLWLDIIGPTQVLNGSTVTYLITYGNTGNLDADGRILLLSFPSSTPYFINLPFPNMPGIPWETYPGAILSNGIAYLPVDLCQYRIGYNYSFPIQFTIDSNLDDDITISASMLSEEQSNLYKDNAVNTIADDPLMQQIYNEYQLPREQFVGQMQNFLGSIEQDQSLIHICLYAIILGLVAGTLIYFFVPPPIAYAVAQGIALSVTTGYAMWQLSDEYWHLAPLAQSHTSQIVNSFDPNDKSGPAGYSTAGYVPKYEQFYYMIHFENADSATAPAVNIWLHDTLDVNLDWSTLQFDTSSHVCTVTTDPTHRAITWYFQHIMLAPDSEGWVMYHVKPDSGLLSGAQIRNWADITFDYNDPMRTDTILNTIDALPPVSRVLPLESTSPTNFTVIWEGHDDSLGSGVGRYTVYKSVNDGPFTVWLANTSDTSAVFTGVADSTYSFYCKARDNVGHQEIKCDTVEAQTQVVLGMAPGHQAALPDHFAIGPVYPNPFNAQIIIALELPENSRIKLELFNVQGRLVATLFDGVQPAGWPKIRYAAPDLASGVYFYRLDAQGLLLGGKFHHVGKMVLIK